MEWQGSADFWIGLLKIVWINIILSGDNAVVIALAARSLPAGQQKKAIFFGSGAAVVLRIALTVVAAKLLELSFLQIVGGLLLLWIGVQLLSEEEHEDTESKGSGGLMAAVRTILIADLVMSLDNVIAVAAAAKLMERFPIIILLGAALIGWVGGETIVGDTALQSIARTYPSLHYLGAVAGAALVILLGKKLQRRHSQ